MLSNMMVVNDELEGMVEAFISFFYGNMGAAVTACFKVIWMASVVACLKVTVVEITGNSHGLF